MGERKTLNVVLGIVLFVSLSLLFVQNISVITGHASVGSTVSNVTISQYLSIDMSSDLLGGIYFGDIQSLPAIDQNATKNYNGTSNATLYYINVSTDSNTNVTFCIRANQGMSNGVETMNLQNESFSASDSSNATVPSLINETSMTTIQQIAGGNIGLGNAVYYRFWLDVPVGQAVGTYNNSVEFEGKNLGATCP
jgi:hypothetical protein